MIKKKCKECGTLIDLHAQEYCEICDGNYGWWYTCDKHQDLIFRDDVKECRVCKAEAHSAAKPSDVPPAKTKKTTPLTPSSREKSTKILPWVVGLVLATLGFGYWLGQNHQDQADPVIAQNEATTEATPYNLYSLAWDYYTKKEYEKAFELARQGADQGHAYSQNLLGSMYGNGKGVPENDAEALKWYRKAAEQGLALAQVNLGYKYAHGEGVPENDGEAVKWYRKAAEQGNAVAQSNLAFMYYNGHGVSKDKILAYKWVNLAAAQGDERAKKTKNYIPLI